jgi:hypothetical protein
VRAEEVDSSAAAANHQDYGKDYEPFSHLGIYIGLTVRPILS